MRGCTRQQGTTLIEVLISILLLSVGLLGLVALNGRTLQTTVDGENRGIAALLANDIVTAAWNLKTPTDTAVTTVAKSAFIAKMTALCAASILPQPATGQRCATAAVGGTDTTGAATITITWTAPGQQSSTQTQPLTSKYVTTVALP